MVYGCPLRLPGAFFTPSTPLVHDPSSYIDRLRQLFQDLKPTPPRSGPATRVVVSPALNQATHVFVCRDSVCSSLQPAYDDSYKVISRAGKFFRLDLPRGPDTVAIDSLKPAFLESAPLPFSPSTSSALGSAARTPRAARRLGSASCPPWLRRPTFPLPSALLASFVICHWGEPCGSSVIIIASAAIGYAQHCA
ncbi:uncharacterized protein LOC135385054 [Ornithodoros turicata]|uniref:uncharacterized protein LOC135385054 n=1 Tax=Ornithodoros turicata TaxID=34597 RepID=UPI00313A021A